MLLCIALIAVYYRLPDAMAAAIAPYKPVFLLESIAIVSFGISWLVKGEIILKDKPTPQEKESKAKAQIA